MVIVALLSGCSTEWLAEHKRGPKPESEWNNLGIWHRVGDTPPTYVPTGYGANQPRTDKDGMWFVDKRDGKRLFVPNHAVGHMDRGVLLGEAKKVTDWEIPANSGTFLGHSPDEI
jgi:hypothetical protein